MNVGIDIRSVSATGRGVDRYTNSLLGELTKLNANWTLLRTGRRPYVLPSEFHGHLKHLRIPNRALNVALMTARRPRLDRLAELPEVFFAPNLGFLPVSDRTPLVLTVHDLSFVTHPELYSTRERWWHRLVGVRRLYQRADRLIAVSGQTKHELIDFGVPAEKIRVVHSGVESLSPASMEEITRVRQRYNLPENYVVFLGALEPRKNLPFLLEGFRQARAAGLRSELVLAGAGEAVNVEGVRALGYIDAADKAPLLTGATALTLVSHHEGFGFPPLEALACGTPAIVSDLPVFAETLGDAAVRVSLDTPDRLAESLVYLEGNESARRELVRKGRSALNRLTWQRAAAETYEVLDEARHAR